MYTGNPCLIDCFEKSNLEFKRFENIRQCTKQISFIFASNFSTIIRFANYNNKYCCFQQSLAFHPRKREINHQISVISRNFQLLKSSFLSFFSSFSLSDLTQIQSSSTTSFFNAYSFSLSPTHRPQHNPQLTTTTTTTLTPSAKRRRTSRPKQQQLTDPIRTLKFQAFEAL